MLTRVGVVPFRCSDCRARFLRRRARRRREAAEVAGESRAWLRRLAWGALILGAGIALTYAVWSTGT